MSRSVVRSVLILAAVAFESIGAEGAPRQWVGQLLRPVARREVYEFTKKPQVRKVGRDRYEVSFASKAKCDVAVAIEDEKGKILRHIVYGVLGPNAPEPLKKNSLEQTLTWDGKDDLHKYVDDPQACRVRVSLGLKPTFDRVMAWHPKDTTQIRRIAAIDADKDGVYVLETCSYNQLRKFDHDGNYVETLIPWHPEKLARTRMPKRTLPDGKVWAKEPPEGGRVAPALMGFGGTIPFGQVGDCNALALAAGRIAAVTTGYGTRWVLRLRTDGTTGGESIYGTLLHKRFACKDGQPHVALSPDGKWIYLTGISIQGRGRILPSRGQFYWNAVFRVPWGRSGGQPILDPDPHVGEKPFVGEIGGPSGSGIGKENHRFHMTEGIACDAQGRLYVCDHLNNRIQVFATDGEHVKTIPIEQPMEIRVHQKTGEIYVLCFRSRHHGYYGFNGGDLTLVKLGPLGNPEVRIQHKVQHGYRHPQYGRFVPVLGLDSWSQPTRVWLTAGAGRVQVFDDRGDSLKLYHDFVEQVRKDGHTPHMMSGYDMPYIAADPVRGHVYLGGAHCRPLRRMDPNEGKKWEVIETRLPSWGRGHHANMDEIGFSRDGLLYIRTLKYVARFDPDRMGNAVGKHAEVPFDYGEEIKHGSQSLRGVVKIDWAMGGANGFNNGFAVAPDGTILCMVDNYQSIKEFMGTATYMDANVRRGKEAMIRDGYRPRRYPGRVVGNGELVWRWSRKGELTGEDLVPGTQINSYGIRSDKDGNIYVGVGYHQMVDGKPHLGGAVVKFPPSGGKFSTSFGKPVPLKQPPNRPAEFCNYRPSDEVWVDNAYWCYPGLDMVFYCDPISRSYPCHCANCRFDTDVYGRCFIPKSYAFTIGVIDTNGNRICEIGRYGNVDSPAMKPGDTDIGIAQCSYVATVSDRWLYLNDDANVRIIRIKLGYRAEESVPIP